MRIHPRIALLALVLLALACASPRQEPTTVADVGAAYDSLGPLMKAAETGDPLAQLELGLRYRDGRGIAADRISAYVWLRLAAVADLDLAVRARDHLATELTDEELEVAEGHVRKWARYYFSEATEWGAAAERMGVRPEHAEPQEPRPDDLANKPATRKALEGRKKQD